METLPSSLGDLTPPRQWSRKFGTPLKDNLTSPAPKQQPRSASSSVKKKARVVVVRQSLPSLQEATASSKTSRQQQPDEISTTEFLVKFAGGPIGLQLEPIDDDTQQTTTQEEQGQQKQQQKYFCRVQGFVNKENGGLSPAQQNGKIQVGDVVLSVNGITVTSYQQAIHILKQYQDTTREIMFGRLADTTSNDSSSKAPATFTFPSVATAAANNKNKINNNGNSAKPGYVRRLGPSTPESSFYDTDTSLNTTADDTDNEQQVPTPEISNVKKKKQQEQQKVTIFPFDIHNENVDNKADDNDTTATVCSDSLVPKELMLSMPPVVTEKMKERQEEASSPKKVDDDVDDDPTPKHANNLLLSTEDKLSLAEIRAELQKERHQREELQGKVEKLQDEYSRERGKNQQELDSARMQLQDQSRQLKERDGQVSVLQREKEAAEAQLKTLQQQNNQLQERLDEETAKNRTSKTELQSTIDALERAEQELATVKKTSSSQADMLRQENKRLREQVEQNRKKWTKAVLSRQGQADNNARVHDLERQLVQEKQRAESAHEEMASLRLTIRERDAALQESEVKAETAQKQLRGIRDANRTAIQGKDEEISQLKDERQCLQKQLEQAQQQVLQHSANVETLEALVDSKDQELEELTETLDRLELENERLSTQVLEIQTSSKKQESMLRAELDRARDAAQSVASAESLINDKDRQLSQTRNQLDSANAKIAKLTADVEDINASLTKANNLVRSLERERNEFSLQDKQLHEDSVLSKAQLAEARSEISELHRQVRSFDSFKRSWKREIESLTKTNEEMSLQIEILQKSIDEKDNKLSAKTVECMTNINQLEDTRDELKEKTDELAACQRALEAVQAQYTELNTRLSNKTEESSREKDTLVSDMHNLQEELTESKARCNELERILRSLRRNASDTEARLSQARELLERERQSSRQVQKSAEATRVAFVDKLEKANRHVSHYKQLSKGIEKERDLFRAEVGSLERKIVSLQDEIKTYKSRQLKSEADLTQEKENILSDLSLERAKASKLSDKLRATEHKLEQKVKDTESKMARYEERLRFARDEVESKARKHDEILRAKESELQKFFETQEELAEAQSAVVRLEESLRRAQQETEQLTSLVDELSEEHSNKVTQLTKHHSQEMERMSKQQADLRQTLRKLEEQKEKAETRLFAAEEGLSAARSERERLITEKNNLVSSLNRAEDTISELKDELHGLQQQCENSVYSDDDSENQEFTRLPRSDLKTKCRALRAELRTVNVRAKTSSTRIVQRDEQLQQLQEDLDLLTSETEKLVETNVAWEDRLKEASLAAEEARTAAASSRSRLGIEEERVKSLEQQLADQVREVKLCNQKLNVAEENIRSVNRDHAAREEELSNEVAILKQLLSEAEADKTTSAELLRRKEDQISEVERRLEETSSTKDELQQELIQTKDKLTNVLEKVDSIKSDSASATDRYTKQIASLEDECAGLRSQAVELEAELEAARVTLHGKNENERSLSEKLEKQRQELLEKEAMREEAVSKLSHASRVVVSQRETIHSHECRAMEAERTASSLSSQIVQLQETMKKLESSSEITGDLRLKQLQELEDKCTLLEQERSDIRAEANSLRDELRSARRRASDFEKMNGSLQSRLEATKEASEKYKSQLSETRSSLEESELTSKKLQNEVESKRMEADHLKARVQLLNATVARLRSDQLLLKEAALQSEFKLAATGENDAQISQLKSEIKAKSSKLESLSEVYHSQQMVLSMSQKLEEQLLKFIEAMIRQVAGAFNKISSHKTDVQASRAELPLGLRALALAGIEWPESKLVTDSAGMDGLSTVIPSVLADLEAKRSQLCSLKKQRAARSLPKISTPDYKPKKLPDTPSIIDALHSIKRVLNEEVLSPEKSHKNDAGLTEYFHKVIHSLEAQIDGLLVDLKSANDALQAKDQLFADLEHLVAHHEMERDRLQQKLESRNAHMRELEEQLKREVSWKRSSEKQLEIVREQLRKAKEDASVLVSSTSSSSNEDKGRASKVAAGRLISKFISEKNKTDKASAFRQWSCQTSAAKAVDQQQQITTELASQLDSTREKLGILKKSLKKKGRGSGLGTVLEGYETT